MVTGRRGYAGATMMAVVRSLGRHDESAFRFRPVSAVSCSILALLSLLLRTPDVVRQPDALEKLLIEHAKAMSLSPLLFPIGDGEVMFLSERAERLSPTLDSTSQNRNSSGRLPTSKHSTKSPRVLGFCYRPHTSASTQATVTPVFRVSGV